MRIIPIAIVGMGVLAALSATPVSAAPNCNQVHYGSCWKCAGWANMPAWSPIACSHSQNTAGGLACTYQNCGVVERAVDRNMERQRVTPGNNSGLPVPSDRKSQPK